MTEPKTSDDGIDAEKMKQRDFAALSTVTRDNEVRVVEYVGDGVWVETDRPKPGDECLRVAPRVVNRLTQATTAGWMTLDEARADSPEPPEPIFGSLPVLDGPNF